MSGYLGPVRDNLKNAYEVFLYPGKKGGSKRVVTGIMPAHNGILNQIRQEKESQPRQFFVSDEQAPQGNEPAGVLFHWLEDGDIVRGHANLLFGSKDKAFQERFMDRVRRIAEQFSQGRAAASNLLLVCLAFIEDINTGQPDPAVKTARITGLAADLAISVIKCELLNAAIQSDSAPEGTAGFRQSLEKNLGSSLVPVNDWPKNGNARIGEYKKALGVLLRRDPVEASRQLRRIHLAFMAGKWEFPLQDGAASKYSDGARREYGIVLAHPDEVEYDMIRDQLAGIIRSNSGVGLDRGRLVQGLETQIEDYLVLVRQLPQAEARSDKEQAEFSRARAELANSLVHFAEKVLVIANSEALCAAR